MKSVKYKFFSDSTADCEARHYLLEMYFLGNVFFGIFIESTQFTTFFHFAIADSFVREVEFCTIVIHSRIPCIFTLLYSNLITQMIKASIKKRYLSN